MSYSMLLSAMKSIGVPAVQVPDHSACTMSGPSSLRLNEHEPPAWSLISAVADVMAVGWALRRKALFVVSLFRMSTLFLRGFCCMIRTPVVASVTCAMFGGGRRGELGPAQR